MKSKPDHPTKLITISEGAERLACSTRTVFQHIAAGRLTAIRLGRRSTRLDEAELEAFIARARSESNK